MQTFVIFLDDVGDPRIPQEFFCTDVGDSSIYDVGIGEIGHGPGPICD